jgi:hypothetical protein
MDSNEARPINRQSSDATVKMKATKRLDKLLFSGLAYASLSISSMAPAIADVPGYVEVGPAWTHTASSCAVDPQQLGKASSNGADLSFLPSAFSDSSPVLPWLYLPLVARCNVVNPLDGDPLYQNPLWNTLIVGYADPDGFGSNTSVTATLMQVSRDTGTVSAIATFNSNSPSDSSGVTERTEELVQFDPPIDFRRNEYYVQLGLLRTQAATRQIPIIYSVRLVHTNSLAR